MGGSGEGVGLGRLIRVTGRTAMNRAMDGDKVAVRLVYSGGGGGGSGGTNPRGLTEDPPGLRRDDGGVEPAGDEQFVAGDPTSASAPDVLVEADVVTAGGGAGVDVSEGGAEGEGGGGLSALYTKDLESLPQGKSSPIKDPPSFVLNQFVHPCMHHGSALGRSSVYALLLTLICCNLSPLLPVPCGRRGGRGAAQGPGGGRRLPEPQGRAGAGGGSGGRRRGPGGG